MSGPDQAHDADTDGITNANENHEHKQPYQSQHSRIPIANLLCSDSEATKSAPWDPPHKDTQCAPSHSMRRSSEHLERISREGTRASEQESVEGRRYDAQDTTPDANTSPDYDVHPRSSPARTAAYDRPIYPYAHHHSPKDQRHPSDLMERRDSGLGRREPDSRILARSPNGPPSSYSSRDATTHHSPIERPSPRITLPQSSSTQGYFAPRPQSAGQRSASLSIDYYQDNCHPYDAEEQRQQHKRMDRSKSDFALHQQNYGPYLDQSPTLEPVPMFTTKRYSTSHSTPEEHSPTTPPPPPPTRSLAKVTSYFPDQSLSPEHGRSSYYHPYPAGRSVQGESRRPSQGIILPPPESLLSVQESRTPTRIYGLDAADVPTRPPLAPSASFGAQPLQNIPDGCEVQYMRRSSNVDAYDGYPPSRDSTVARSPYSYERRPSAPTTYADDSRHQNATRSRYDYSSQEVRRPASIANSPSPYQPSNPHPRSESRGYSPEIQPPSWYQQYAHAVPNKAQPPRSSFSHGDSAAYVPSPRRGSDYGPVRNVHPQHRASPEPWSARSSFSVTPPSADNGMRRMSGSAGHGGHSYAQGLSKPLPKSKLSAGPSVHPFDLPAESQASSSPLAGKRERGQEDDPCTPEDSGVKAKRKRANAEQLSVLNAAFERSYFPSTEERLRLSKQTKMCPRTVQIWFQNKRQSVKARTEAMDAAVAALPGRRRGSQQVLDRGINQTTARDQAGPVDDRHERTRASDDSGTGQHMHDNRLHPHHHLLHHPHYHHNPQLHSSLKLEHQHSHSANDQQQQGSSFQGEKRRNSGPLTPSDALMSSLQIQYDGRSVDFFSRKRRATVARMELSDPR
ncbi:hypothetical protein BGZ67_010232 [Mortierella alpina]|nr:hypothetical protein BGZ67_010232 [Mortierella alpina]